MSVHVSGVEESERSLQDAVIQLARLLGYRVAHFRPARTAHGWKTPVAADGAGWPDLVLVKPGRIVYAELKAAKGKLRPEQEAWLEALEAAGAETYVWRTDDFDSLPGLLAAKTRPEPRAA